jgi:hypothetical protein
MDTVEQLIATARAQGERAARGIADTAKDFNSTKLGFIVPAMAAIESGDVKHEAELSRNLVKAYVDGTGTSLSEATLSKEVSNVASFLTVAGFGIGTDIIKAMQRVAASENDEAVSKKMVQRAYEKACRCMVEAKKLHAEYTAKRMNIPPMPSDEFLRTTLINAGPEKTNDEKLAAIFKAIKKAMDSAAAENPAKYAALATEAVRFHQLQLHHESEAKLKEASLTAAVKHVAADRVQPVQPESETAQTDEYAELLGA